LQCYPKEVTTVTTQDLPFGELQPDDPEYDADNIDNEEHERERIVVIVFAPKDPEPKRFRFRLDETVGEAAKLAAARFAYRVGTPSFQTEGGTVFDRTLTLRAAGVHNREKLELVDAGGGV
jgi:hypothetical protein